LEQISLKKTAINSIIPKTQSMIIIRSEETISQAFHKLILGNVYSAPVYNSEKEEYVGFLDLLDVISFIVNIIDSHPSPKKNEEPDLYQLLEQSEKFDLERTMKVVGIATKNPMCPIHSNASVKKALEIFVRSGAHRLPVVEGKFLRSIVTESTLIRWIGAHLSEISVQLRKKTIRELGIGLKEVISVRLDTNVIEAFRLMVKHNIHGVAVLDVDGTIFSNISVKDIKTLEPDAIFTKMYRSTLEVIQMVRSVNLKAVFPSFCVSLDTTLQEAINKLVVLRVHRLYIEDEKRRPVGVLSLGDVLRILMQDPEERISK